MIPYKDEQVPKGGGEYLLSSLPQYEDVKSLRKLVDEVLGQVRTKIVWSRARPGDADGMKMNDSWGRLR